MNKSLIKLSLDKIKRKFEEELGWLSDAAKDSPSSERFAASVNDMLEKKKGSDIYIENACAAIRTFIKCDGKTIHELSYEKNIRIETFSVLWKFLRGEYLPDFHPDFFIDVYFLFMQAEGKYFPVKYIGLRSHMRRWKSGLDEDIVDIRAQNKDRIINLLVHKISHRYSPQNHYKFEPEMTHEQKVEKIHEWWFDYRFHLSAAIKSPTELNLFMDYSLSPETMLILMEGRKKGMPFFVTPYYLSLLDVTGKEFYDSTIRSYIIYSEKLVKTYGDIRAWEKEDTVVSGEPNAAGWLLPNHNNIHRRYPEVAIMIPDSIGRACGGLCASYQRMYDFQSQRLNFDFQSLMPKESWDKKLGRLMEYFENDTQLRDILITGGDALMSQNKTLRKILDAVYRMSKNKRKANINRPDGEKYAEIKRVRLGTRLPAYLPVRVNEELVAILRDFKEKALTVGIEQFIIQTHFQSPLEMTVEAREAINKILSAGWIITNQLVFTVNASRRGHTAKLRKVLNEAGVVCYYTFSVKGFEENYELFTPNSRSIQESIEEKSAGRLSSEKIDDLIKVLNHEGFSAKKMQEFLFFNKVPFVATDRNVLNLPGVGKSMSFDTVGISRDGKRILRFRYDHSRKHSPIIDKIPEVYIIENKSVAEYLRQLKTMGEDINEYSSIWSYRSGETEPKFRLYEYPDYDFTITDEITNLKI